MWGENMIKLLRKILGLCQHEWKIHRETKVYSDKTTQAQLKNSLPIGEDYTLVCTKCGNIKAKKVRH